MAIYPHSSPHLQIRPSLVHPFLPQHKLRIQMHLDFSVQRMGILLVYIKSKVGDDGVPAILQYNPSDLYLTDRKETMTIYPHSSPHLQIRPSLVHPFLPQDLDVPFNARASC